MFILNIMDYKNKTVIVTGAGRGIGSEIARQYVLNNANVIIAERDNDLGMKTCETLRSSGGSAEFILTDVGDPESIVRMVEQVKLRHGKIDILINNAGISKQKSPYELSVEEWDEIINVNLRAIFLCSREVARLMRENGGGSIVNIASTRAFMSEPDSEAYAASKGGIVSLTHALAASFAKDHIQVNCISPGWIETGDYAELRGIDHKQHLSGRVGRPADIAMACLYLTDEGNNFINGSNIIIDGGMTRKMIYEA